MRSAPPTDARGFSLIEVVVALGILAFLMVGVLASSGGTATQAIQVLDVTTASQLIESVVLDLEEEYRKDGFPTNQLEGRRCEVPRGFERYRCDYDLLALNINAENLGSKGAEANENVNHSPLMTAFCSGGPNGDMPVDPAMALANLAADTGQIPGGLLAFQALLDPGFNEICGINLNQMCQNTANITMFIPMIIEQAAKSTRKLVVRLAWGDASDATKLLQIETFITSIPEAEPDAQAGGGLTP